jgi:putative flippase GtrA
VYFTDLVLGENTVGATCFLPLGCSLWESPAAEPLFSASTFVTLEKLLRYCSVGLIVFLFQEAALWCFHHWTSWGPRVNFWAAWAPSVTLHFLLTKYVAFRRHGGDIRGQIVRYACATVVTTSFQYAAYHLALRFVTEQPNLAFGIAAVVSFCLNFVVMKWGVFERKPAQNALA